jgi:mono/diheme cytochrome c family protein
MKACWMAVLFLIGTTALWARGRLTDGVGTRDGSRMRNGSWMNKVPAVQRSRVNPYAGQTQAAASGRILFVEHCAKCHGENALGRRGPSLRSTRIENATDGDLAWILRNGSVAHGMPSWSRMPEPERWQIIAYLRSLPQQRNDVATKR